MKNLSRTCVFLFMIALASHGSTAAEPGPVLGISGDRLTVDGASRFLVVVAYVDGLRASSETLESDFRVLRVLGVDGLRVFPNWWQWSDMKRFPDDTVMDGQGDVRPERLAKLKALLDLAAKHGLVVDVSFAYETVGGLSDLREEQLGVGQGALPVNQLHVDDYERGLVSLAMELKSYRNIFFDIQNEYNGRITHLSDEEVTRFAKAIKAVDPERIVSASLANEIGPEHVAKKAEVCALDLVNWHESRNPWQFAAMDALVQRAKAVSSKPVYLGEPAYMGDEYSVDDFAMAVAKSKSGGAAAWTFHTQNGFDLGGAGLMAQLTRNERAFLGRLKETLGETE